ncbi:MAG: hypothetical protein ABSD41_13385, partial [Candidatus Bathyarchaeia archaeon]
MLQASLDASAWSRGFGSSSDYPPSEGGQLKMPSYLHPCVRSLKDWRLTLIPAMKGVGFSARFDKKRNRARHKPSRSLRTYSFLVTLALLALIVGGSYYSTLPTVEHIPVNFQFQSSGWMAFVPQTSQYVSFIDYHEAYMVSGNPLLFG